MNQLDLLTEILEDNLCFSFSLNAPVGDPGCKYHYFHLILIHCMNIFYVSLHYSKLPGAAKVFFL